MTEFDLDYRTGFYGRTGCRRLLMRDRPGHILSVRALHADIESGIQERFIGLNRRIAVTSGTVTVSAGVSSPV